MGTNENLVLIYDKDCPFCKWYTGLFVKYGFLNKNGRIPFDVAIENEHFIFDLETSKNKIALFNKMNNEVEYGIDSLLTVLNTKFKYIKTIGKLPIIYQFLNLFYSFISFNRKVIAPSKFKEICSGKVNCEPSKNYFWRIFFIIICGILVNYSTWIYFNQHLEKYFIATFEWIDLIFFTSQFLFQYIIFKLLKQKNFYDYAGQIAFISFLGGILLLVFHFGLRILNEFKIDIEMLEPLCYGIVYMFMLMLHSKRIKMLKISAWMSVSWVLFRFIIYPFAFKTM